MIDNLARIMPWSQEQSRDLGPLLTREWLVTNGLGGYASGTVSGINTRRYHGLLVAALPSPFGRMVMLDQLNDSIIYQGGTEIRLSGEERVSCALQMHGNCFLSEFVLEKGLPVWRYNVDDINIEKRIFMRYQQNTIQIIYKLVSGNSGITLNLHPNVHFRQHHENVSNISNNSYSLSVTPDYYELSAGSDLPVMRMQFNKPAVTFIAGGVKIEEFIYREEANQGYPSKGDLWDPGYFQVKLEPGQEIHFVASTHSLSTIKAITVSEAIKAENERRELLLGAAHPDIRQGIAAELVFAADQFIITPAGRREDTARIRASGGEVRTIIAGYHWFTDWGRDTMISLEGLTLLTGRQLEARWILHTFAHYIHNGLIPNMFPEGQKQGIYNTSDATLWYFHALDRYLEYTNDRTTLRLLLPKLIEIVEHHLRGTDYNIGVDPDDGLLRQGQEGYALTWMDAKVEDWVVTPRRGKAVEINALWYNALRLLERWVSWERGENSAQYLAEQARKVRKSFNKRFWYADGDYLYDVVDGEHGVDSSCRPNQLLAISLHFPVLEHSKWQPVLEVVTRLLLTPFGLRSLSPESPDYKPKYFGDIRARDAAYHQGTVWSWLIGPYIDAWLKAHAGTKEEAREILNGIIAQLDEACIGTISEIFDAERPFTPRGCVAQAWSVAEFLRCWVKTTPTEERTSLIKKELPIIPI